MRTSSSAAVPAMAEEIEVATAMAGAQVGVEVTAGAAGPVAAQGAAQGGTPVAAGSARTRPHTQK